MKHFLLVTAFLAIAGCSTDKVSDDNVDSIIQEIKDLGGFIIQDELDDIVYTNLSSCQINSSLLQKLSTLDKLQYLHLENTNIENKDLEYIGKISSLEVLNINMTHTTDEGLFFLLPIANLKELKMSHYSLTRPLPEELKNITVDDMQNMEADLQEIKPDYGEGIRALTKKFPALKAELWGALPQP